MSTAGGSLIFLVGFLPDWLSTVSVATQPQKDTTALAVAKFKPCAQP